MRTRGAALAGRQRRIGPVAVESPLPLNEGFWLGLRSRPGIRLSELVVAGVPVQVQARGLGGSGWEKIVDNRSLIRVLRQDVHSASCMSNCFSYPRLRGAMPTVVSSAPTCLPLGHWRCPQSLSRACTAPHRSLCNSCGRDGAVSWHKFQ
jgi:hypothetical protein